MSQKRKESSIEKLANIVTSVKGILVISTIITSTLFGIKYYKKRTKNRFKQIDSEVNINSESLGYDSLIPFTVKQSNQPTKIINDNSKFGTISYDILPQNIALRRSDNYFKFMNMRRSVRFFRTDIIPDINIIINCIKTANTAPSGAHLSPWTFVIVKSKKLKKLIRIEVEKEEQINYERRMKKSWVNDVMTVVSNLHASNDIKKPYLEDAPYLIVVMKEMYRIDKKTNKKIENYYPSQSTGIATGILFTALHNAGIFTLPSTPMGAEANIRNICKRKENEKVFLLMPCGYPPKNATIPWRNTQDWRKDINKSLVIM